VGHAWRPRHLRRALRRGHLGRCASHQPLRLRYEPAGLERRREEPHARTRGWQPMDRLQLGKQCVERRHRLAEPERRLPRGRRCTRGCGSGARAGGARRGRQHVGHRAHPGLRGGGQERRRRRQPDAELPAGALQPVAARQGVRVREPPEPRRRRCVPRRVRVFSGAGVPERAHGPVANHLLLARQRAGPVVGHAPSDPAAACDVRGPCGQVHCIRRRDQERGAGCDRVWPRELRVGGLRELAGRPRCERP
jgi:hypothetical protein